MVCSLPLPRLLAAVVVAVAAAAAAAAAAATAAAAAAGVVAGHPRPKYAEECLLQRCRSWNARFSVLCCHPLSPPY